MRTVFELLANSRAASELRDISFNTMTSLMIAQAAQRGDAIALQAFDRTGYILGLDGIALALVVRGVLLCMLPRVD